MFETDRYEPHRPGARSIPATEYTLGPLPNRRAFLVWGEHCVECTAPNCFKSCDLYDPRPDERCRRFEYGIYANPAYPTTRGVGAEVVFKQWGKLEARGNARLLSERACTLLESSVRLVLPLSNGAGRLARILGAPMRWAYLSFGLLERFNRTLLRRSRVTDRPDAFVAEIVNPSGQAVTLLMTMAVDRGDLGRTLTADQVPPPFTQRLTIEPGHNRIVVPGAKFGAITDSRLPFNIALVPEAESGTHLIFLALDLGSFDATTRATKSALPVATDDGRNRPAAKCVVFDLDNTLWDGILLEGPVRHREGIKDLFRRLDERGILISIASKNSPEDAMREIDALGVTEYVLFPQISWSPKSKSLETIAERISISLDTFIFVDDNPFEREEVLSQHPEIEVLPDSILAGLLDHPRLKGSDTPEARQRRSMYQDAIKRETAAVTFGDDYLEFLRNCEIVIEILPITNEHKRRVTELVQRTNQLNFSGRKYSREQMNEVLTDARYGKHVITCSDRFGSYGVVGFALTRPVENGVRVEDFMLSCRVQGKFVEQALFDYLARATDPPVRYLEVNFVRTDRNGLAEAVLRKIGFDIDNHSAGAPLRLDLSVNDLSVSFLTVRDIVAEQPDTR